MGNSSSTNVFLTVYDSRTLITAGSTLTGEIRCPDHSVSNDLFSGVTLYFIGREDVEVQYTELSSDAKGKGAKFKAAKRDIVRTIIPLDTSRSSVEAGRYPFQFHVPDQLPSSMYYKDGNGGYCAIRYKVKLHLLRGRDQEISLDIMAKRPNTSPVPSVPDPAPSRISFLYCVPQGSITWAAGVENTRVGIGENVIINLGMKNESFTELERVTAKLKQTVEWHSFGHSSTNKSVIRSSSFERTDSMGPCKKDGIKSKMQPTTVYEQVLNTVQEGNNQVAFPIPDYIPQSYVGRLIKIQYYISITAKTPSCFTSPKIHIPIEIVSPKNTPPVVTARAIPMPSAPPQSFDECWVANGVDAPNPSNAPLLASAVSLNHVGEEERLLGSVESKELMTGMSDYIANQASDPTTPGFGTISIEPPCSAQPERASTCIIGETPEPSSSPIFDTTSIEPSSSSQRERTSTY